jgi:hypothetical protein
MARPTRLEENELWKMRALMSKKESLVTNFELHKTRMNLIQKEVEEIDKDLKVFQNDMLGKYGEDVQAMPDGTLQYSTPEPEETAKDPDPQEEPTEDPGPQE